MPELISGASMAQSPTAQIGIACIPKSLLSLYRSELCSRKVMAVLHMS